MSFRKIVSALLLLFVVVAAQAQGIRLNGQVTNGTTRQPMEYATIVLQTAADSAFVSGTTSGSKGEFAIENIPAGDYRLVCTSIGFDTVQVELPELNKSADVGAVEMHESATRLAEVTVEGASVLNKSDRKTYFVSETQRAGASNGLNLITRMNIPRLVFNPLQNSVTSVDNKSIEFRINDIPAQKEDILALQPRDIVRVEYIDNPGLKYGADAGYVLNYIVRRRASGGSAGVDLNHSFNRHFHVPSAFAKVHSGKSEILADFYLKSLRLGGLMRTIEETFRFADGKEWVREEIGRPSVMRENQQSGRLAYNYTDPDKRIFNATLRFYGHDHPNMDFISQSFWRHNPAQKTGMEDRNSDSKYTSMADIYYMEKLKNEQTLIFNIVYSNRRSKVGRHYFERLNDKVLTDISTRVQGNRNAYIGEALYEKVLPFGKLTSGIKHQQAYTENSYSGNVKTVTEMVQYDSYLYSELSGKIKGRTDYVAGIGISRVQVNQQNAESLKNYFFQPRIRLRYHFDEASYLGLESRLNNRTPSLSQLSAVCQPIDSLQQQCGNPSLKPWLDSFSAMEYSLNTKTLNLNAKAMYQRMHRPVMGEKIRENGFFVHTFDNQKSWQHTGFELSVGYRPFGDYLVLNVTGGYSRFISIGNHYRHTFNDFYHSETIALNYKRFVLTFMYQRGKKWFFGEEYDANETIHLLDLTYTHPKFSTGFIIFNPFTKNYKRDSENFSGIAPRRHTWYSNRVQGLVLLKFAYNLRWGEEYKSARRRLNNSDSESGILSGGK